MERLVYLVDSNVFLEGLLKQQKANEVKYFFEKNTLDKLFISDFSLHSIGIILISLNDKDTFRFFIKDMILSGIRVLSINPEKMLNIIDNSNRFNLDFDDAYQYTIAKNYDLKLVSLDKDFDKTDIKRLEL